MVKRDDWSLENWERRLLSQAKSLWARDSKLVLAGFLTAMASYAYYVFGGALELEGLGSIASRIDGDKTNYFAPARYIFYFVSRYIGSASFTPWLSLIIFCACISVGAALIVRLFGPLPEPALCVGAMLIVSFPFFSAQVSLWLWTLAFGFAFLTASVASYVVCRRGSVVAATSILSATLLNYQPAFGLFLAAVCLHLASVFLHMPLSVALKDAGQVVLKGSLSVLVSLALYLLALRFSRQFSNQYTDRITGFDFGFSSIFDRALEILKRSYEIPFSGRFHEMYPVLVGFILVLAVIGVWGFVSNQNVNLKPRVAAFMFVAALFVCAILASIPFNLVLSDPVWWQRTWVSIGIVFAFIFVIAASSVYRWIRRVGFLLALAGLFWFVQGHNAVAFSQKAMNQFDNAVTQKIIAYTVAHPSYVPGSRYMIVAVNPGWHMSTRAAGSAFYRTNVFAAYTGEFQWWTENLFQLNGLHGVSAAPNPQAVRERFSEEIETMGVWPRPDSVEILEGRYIIVRLR